MENPVRIICVWCGKQDWILAARRRSVSAVLKPHWGLIHCGFFKSVSRFAKKKPGVFAELFLSQELELIPDTEAATTDQILPLVKNNLGLAFLPEPMALESLAKQEVLQIAISEKLPLRHICLVHDHQHPLNSGARELKKIILGERMD